MLAVTLAICLIAFINSVQCAVPSYIRVCKRNDPNIEKCILDSVEHLKPKLAEGIPELDIPSIDPLHIPEIIISRGGAFRAIGKDILVHGTSDYEITNFKADIINLIYQIGIRFPRIRFEGEYDVNLKLLNVPLKGKGPITANATDPEGNVILKGHKVTKNGRTYVHFDSLDVKLKLKNYDVKLENLFNGDKTLGEAVNNVLNENKKELMTLLRPRAEQIVSAVLLDIANKITTHFDYDDLFPLN